MTFSSVLAQQAITTIQVVNPESGAIGSQVNVQGTIDTPNGSYLIYFGEILVVNGTSDGYSVNGTFTIPNLPAGNYNITLQNATSNQGDIASFMITVPVGSFAVPWSTLSIMAISFSLAIINSGLNRILISRFVGWEDYKTIQKETK